MNKDIQKILTDTVKNDESVKNCVLSVMNSEGTVSFSGAAGIADCQTGALMTAATPYCIASITKMFTAVIIIQMSEKGLLSLEDPFSKYLPHDLIEEIHIFKGVDYTNDINIRHLLSHTSGIPDYYSAKSDDGKCLYDQFLAEPGRKWTIEDTIDRARYDLKPRFKPGEKVSYSDTNFQLLGKIIESVTEMPLYRVYEEYIFKPLTLKNTWLVNFSGRLKPLFVSSVYQNDEDISLIRSNGTYWADGGLISTAEDCIAFLKALKEERLVSSESLIMMHQWKDMWSSVQYGMGTMFIEHQAESHIPSLWGHSGSSGSFLYYSEDRDIYIAGTLNQTVLNRKPFRLMEEVFKAVP